MISTSGGVPNTLSQVSTKPQQFMVPFLWFSFTYPLSLKSLSLWLNNKIRGRDGGGKHNGLALYSFGLEQIRTKMMLTMT